MAPMANAGLSPMSSRIGERDEGDAERDQHRLRRFLVGEELLEKQVVRRFEVTGLPDDDAVDRVDAQAALDDRDESLVLGTVDHDDGRVRFVLLDEFVGLACDAPVGADAVAAVPEHYDDRVVAVGFEVAGHAQPLEHRVDATVFRVVDTDLGDGGFDGTLTVYRQGEASAGNSPPGRYRPPALSRW